MYKIIWAERVKEEIEDGKILNHHNPKSQKIQLCLEMWFNYQAAKTPQFLMLEYVEFLIKAFQLTINQLLIHSQLFLLILKMKESHWNMEINSIWRVLIWMNIWKEHAKWLNLTILRNQNLIIHTDLYLELLNNQLNNGLFKKEKEEVHATKFTIHKMLD